MNGFRPEGPAAHQLDEAALLEQMLGRSLAQQRDAERVTLARRIEAGGQLTRLKELLPYGEWGALLGRRKISQATAWRRMRDYRDRERIIHVNDLEAAVAASSEPAEDEPTGDGDGTSGEPGGGGPGSGRRPASPAPAAGTQATIDFDLTRRQTERVVELLEEGRVALDTLATVVGELLGGLRAADVDELLRDNGLHPRVRERVQPVVVGEIPPDADTGPDTYLPCLSALDIALRVALARVRDES